MTTVLDITADPRRLRGRGALSNAAGRHERERRVLFDDGWSAPAEDEPPPLKTEVLIDTTRTIIARNNSPDISFQQSINPYRGCEHGCIYCFARPTHAYLGFSPGADFESKLFAKPEAAKLLAKELSAPGYVPKVLAIGTNTDPYQPLEKKMRIMREVLEVLHEFRHPVGIVTKSALIQRDLDILAPMAALGLARVALSVTTLDRKLARVMEPRAATPPRRLETIRALKQAGVPVAVMFAPVIPALNDDEMENVLEATADAGAETAGYVLLRLPLELGELFTSWLNTHVPERAGHVLSLIRQMRGGRLNDPNFGSRFSGGGPYAEMLAQRFNRAVRQHNLADRFSLDSSKFQAPKAEPQTRQLSLF